jgi:hypothetical protein
LTAALAYDAMPYSSPFIDEDRTRTAAQDVAVAWAVTRYAHSHPATVEDRLTFEAAEADMLRIAKTLGYDECRLRALLHECVQRERLRLVERQCLDDAPA